MFVPFRQAAFAIGTCNTHNAESVHLGEDMWREGGVRCLITVL